MLEVETKYRVSDWTALRAILTEWQAVHVETRRDADHYFNAPDRDFASTDEAFRIRRIGTRNFFTYKGPKRDKQTKTRTELELAIADGPEAATKAVIMLTHLGYRPVAVVTKTREVYRFTRDGFPIEACFDDVGSVGRFVELEIQATEAQYETAKAVLLSTATTLGLVEQERHSYLELLLSQPMPTPAPRGTSGANG